MSPIDPDDVAFAAFFEERLRPAIREVSLRRSRALAVSVAVGLAAAVLFGFASYMILSPYVGVLAEHDIAYWPLLVFVPAAIGVVAFSVSYILGLRSAVASFRSELVTRLAGHIAHGVRLETDQPVPAADLEHCLLFAPPARPQAGKDSFRAMAGPAAATFCDLRLPPADGAGEKGKGVQGGLFFRAEYPRPFRTFLLSAPAEAPVSVSGLTSALHGAGELDGELVRLDGAGRQTAVEAVWQGLAGALVGGTAWSAGVAGLAARGIQTSLSFRGRVLTVAMLSRRERLDLPGAFDGFDFGNCREFCRCARVCLDFARETAEAQQAFV